MQRGSASAGVREGEKPNSFYSDSSPSDTLSPLKWLFSTPNSHFERCKRAIRQPAQREGEEGAGELSGGFTERVLQEDQT